MTERVLIYRAGGDAGLGHALISLLNAAVLARKLGRTLTLDMRAFLYFAQNQHRRFFECFALEAPPDLPVVTDLAEVERLSAIEDCRLVYEHAHLDGIDAATEQVIVVRDGQQTTSYPMAAKTSPPQFRIGLRGWLAERMAPALAGCGPAIGVYFRHGNGEFLHGRLDSVLFADHEAQYAALKQRYAARALALAEERGLSAPRFFIASDSADFVASMKAALPGAFSLAAQLPDRSFKQHLRQHAHSDGILFEAAQDIWALSSCVALLCSSSLFARFAALNSATLRESDIFDIEAPNFLRLLDSLPPGEAVARAEAAYRTQELGMIAVALVKALRRAGNTGRAAVIEQRMRWQREAGLSVPVRAAATEAHDGRLRDAIAHMGQAVADAPNPYVHLHLARLLLRARDAAGAEAAVRAGLALDDGIAGLHEMLGKLRAR